MTKFQKNLTAYFTPGALVESYAGWKDKVIDFDWNNGSWKVKVQAVLEDGSIDSRWPNPRVHCTEPKGMR